MQKGIRAVKPKKFLGQHFLKDTDVARRIADTVDACPGLPLLEVGAGTGALTQHLVDKGRELKVVEIDRESVRYLLGHYPSLEGRVIEADFLQMPLDGVFEGRSFVLTGNYPYNISSQIFFRLIEHRHLVPCCTGMVQKEVGERLASPPGRKAYGILSVLVQAWYDVELLFTVDEGVFDPPPKVKSAVVRLTRNGTASLGCDERLFRTVVKAAFGQRRKTLRNALSPLLASLGLDAQRLTQGEPFGKRAEQLSVAQFVDLTNLIQYETQHS